MKMAKIWHGSMPEKPVHLVDLQPSIVARLWNWHLDWMSSPVGGFLDIGQECKGDSGCG